MMDDEKKRENLTKDMKDGKVKPVDLDFKDWVFPEKYEEFSREDKIVMVLKYGQEVVDDEWSVNTFKDDQVIEGSNKFLKRNLERIEQVGRQKQFKSSMSDPLSIKFNK